MVIHAQDDGGPPVLIPLWVLRLVLLVNVLSVQASLVVGLGAWLALAASVSDDVARASIAIAAGAAAGSFVFARLTRKWGAWPR